MTQMGGGSLVTEDGDSSDRHRVVEDAEETCQTGSAIGAEPGHFHGRECWKETDEDECWPRGPGDRLGWTFLPHALVTGDLR
jgi:hypothetical protein